MFAVYSSILLFATILFGPIEAEKKPSVVFMVNGLTETLLQQMPHLKKLYSEGLSGKLEQYYPVEDGPVRFSIATGMQPQDHGIVANEMLDKHGKHLGLKDSDTYHYNENVEPLWTANEGRTICHSWPGTGFRYKEKSACRKPQKTEIADVYEEIIEAIEQNDIDLAMIYNPYVAYARYVKPTNEAFVSNRQFTSNSWK